MQAAQSLRRNVRYVSLVTSRLHEPNTRQSFDCYEAGKEPRGNNPKEDYGTLEQRGDVEERI